MIKTIAALALMVILAGIAIARPAAYDSDAYAYAGWHYRQMLGHHGSLNGLENSYVLSPMYSQRMHAYSNTGGTGLVGTAGLGCH